MGVLFTSFEASMCSDYIADDWLDNVFMQSGATVLYFKSLVGRPLQFLIRLRIGCRGSASMMSWGTVILVSEFFF